MNELCKIVSDLSLEYRTVHARLLQRKERRKRRTGGLIPFVRAHSALGGRGTADAVSNHITLLLTLGADNRGLCGLSHAGCMTSVDE